MILGVGTDIINIERIVAIFKRSEQQFVKKIFTPAERALCDARQSKQRISAYAKRFAAKEAAAKALGVGIGAVCGWQDIEVTNTKTGQPQLTIAMSVYEKLGWPADVETHISLSDEKDNAIAFVVLSQK